MYFSKQSLPFTSFHVGSGCFDGTAYSEAVASARAVFDVAKEVGYHFKMLNIGGGFPGSTTAKVSFEEVRYTVKPTRVTMSIVSLPANATTFEFPSVSHVTTCLI